MSFRNAKQACKLLLLAAIVSWMGQQRGRAGDLCDFCCPKFHCPPRLKHCWEGPPRFCFRQGCPKPICNPCDQPNWGYFQTCWTPWPWPPNWSHCPVQPPASMVSPGGPSALDMPVPPRPGVITPDSVLPPPRRFDRPGL